MDLEAALKRIAELEQRVARLETRLDNQYDFSQNLLHRVGDLERGAEGGKKTARAS
ncbi:MAG: hypothetical protein ACLQBK_12055 [Candidatus Sulfotelmatobacter sp.]